MEEKTYTLNIRQTSTYHYEVTMPETGATKTAPSLESVLTITLHDSVKHLTLALLSWCSQISMLIGTVGVSTRESARKLIWTTKPLLR